MSKYLSKAELDLEIQTWRSTDSTPVRERAFRRIYDNVSRWVGQQAKKICRSRPEAFDDVFQAGMLELLRALKSYDPTRPAKFLSFAGKLLVLDMRREFNRGLVRGYSKPLVYWDRELPDTSGPLSDKMAEGVIGPASFETRDATTQIRRLVDALPAGPRKDLVEALLSGKELKEVQTRRGVSKQTTHQMLTRTLREFRNTLDLWNCMEAV